MKIKQGKSVARAKFIGGALAIGLVLIGGVAYIHHITTPPPVVIEQPKLAKAHVDGTKPTPKQKTLYNVPANQPRSLVIDKLGIDANILPMGITADGALDAPKTAWDVGWYNQSALPGSNTNALLIDGHVNDALNTPGVFYKIGTLQPGDKLRVERGDKKTFNYHVIKTEQKPIEQVDMAKMLRSGTPGTEGLNLITCGGEYDYRRETYRDRILIYAVRD